MATFNLVYGHIMKIIVSKSKADIFSFFKFLFMLFQCHPRTHHRCDSVTAMNHSFCKDKFKRNEHQKWIPIFFILWLSGCNLLNNINYSIENRNAKTFCNFYKKSAFNMQLIDNRMCHGRIEEMKKDVTHVF